jgi:predicted transcriptional regulator
MELSPLARERLAKAGELSSAEKEKLKYEEEMTSILSEFFTGKMDTEGLWTRMKAYMDEGKEDMVKEMQLRLVYTLSLGGSDADFKNYSSGVLSLETLKSPNRYPEIEAVIKTIEMTRQQYESEKTKMFNNMKNGISDQVKRAAEQAVRQSRRPGATVDMESSIEASVRNSQQWRQFVVRFEKEYDKRFEAMISKLVQLL